jgi:hypothetical protein
MLVTLLLLKLITSPDVIRPGTAYSFLDNTASLIRGAPAIVTQGTRFVDLQ